MKKPFNKNKILNRLWFFLLFLGIISFAIQFTQFTIWPLRGYSKELNHVEFSWKSYFNGTYQIQKESYLTRYLKTAPIFARAYNEYFFRLFHKAKANNIYIGDDWVLNEYFYIESYLGNDLLDKNKVDSMVEKVKSTQLTISGLNKQFLYVVTPNKTEFFKDFFDETKHAVPSNNNYKQFIKAFNDKGIKYIDFNHYFNHTKFDYPVFTKGGIHWSQYAAALAADSIIKYIRHEIDSTIYPFESNNIEVKQAEKVDIDVWASMNLLIPNPYGNAAYPIWKNPPAEVPKKLNMLVISDSFFWQLYSSGFENWFQNLYFNYYNQLIYQKDQSKDKTMQNLKEMLDQCDIIIVMSTEAKIKDAGWGFFDDVKTIYQTSN